MPKFAKTFCSQCGQEFGPGDHGFSHCSDHQGKIIGQTGPLTYAELEMSAMLQERGWTKKNADEEARRALADAAEEDGYDGP
jgi:hypothetical protein